MPLSVMEDSQQCEIRFPSGKRGTTGWLNGCTPRTRTV